MKLFERLVVAVESLAETQKANLELQQSERKRRLAFDEACLANQAKANAMLDKSISPPASPTTPAAMPLPKKSS